MPIGIYKRTKKHRESLSKARIGVEPWNKGKTNVFSKETLKKMSNAKLGKKLSDEVKKKMSEAMKGKHDGNKNPAWKGGKIKTSGYFKIWNPGHPFCDAKGYVFEHRLIMEKHIGRFLEKEEIVHHINENRVDNKIENLKLLKNKSEHYIEHIESHKKHAKAMVRKRWDKTRL